MSGGFAPPTPPSLCREVPSPVWRFDAAELPNGELWIKDDGHLHPRYGGNKVRKLGRVIAAARAAGARRILTMGAAGSHHVLATTLFGHAQGLRTAAVLSQQPWSPHAEQTLASAMAWGLEPYPLSVSAALPVAALALRRRSDYLLPVGGWGVPGSLGFVDAAVELAAQLNGGALPPPDVIVLALGSGGMIAGLHAGLRREGIDTALLGVSVFSRWKGLARAQVLPLATRVLAASERTGPRPPSTGEVQLVITTAELGRGYGWATPDSDRAAAIAARSGLELDATYTAKTFAAALRLLGCRELTPEPAFGPPPITLPSGRIPRSLRVLYWHSLSAVSMETLLRGAPARPDLPPELRRLWTRH